MFPVRASEQLYKTQYVPTIWQVEQGLPGNSVTALVQDHNGYLWIGTFGGLARFDGERFRLLDATATPGFDNNNILCLYQSRPGVLWIGTVTGGLFRLENGVATKYDDRHGLPGRLIESIHGDKEGNVWADTSGGLARFAAGKWEPYLAHRGTPVRHFYLQAQDGSMWFRSGTDLVRFGADGSVAVLHVRKPGAFLLVQEARDGSVWVANRDEYRLVRYYQGVFSDVPLPPVGRRQWLAESPEYLLAMTKATDGELLLITPAGLVRTVGAKLSPPEPVSLPANPGELPKVRTVVADREGNLWVGMIGKGLVRLRLAPLTAYAKEEGLSDASFNTVFQDREGRIWMGGDFLYWFDQRRFQRVPGLGDVRAIAQTRDGDLWFGGYGGLYRWRSGVLSHFSVGSWPVKSIQEDRDGSLWIGVPMEQSRGGLYRFRGGKADPVSALSGVRQMIPNRDGGFWVDAREGLFQLRDGKLSLYEQNQNLPPGRVRLHEDSTGTLWFATNGWGLYRLRSGRLQAITAKDGLPTNMLGEVLGDGKGNLWVTSNLGISRLAMQDLNDFADGKIGSVSPVTYAAAEGMRSSECNSGGPGPWRTADGRIWFPTVRGVVAVDPDAGSRLPPPVVVEEGSAGKVRLGVDGSTSAPPGNNTFDFRFTALYLSDPGEARFKHRLEPFEKDWVDDGTGRTAHYTNMPPGSYSFHVIAANSFGVWNDEGTSVRFVLRPHIYQTRWFYAFEAALVLTLLWFGYLFRVRKIRHEFNVRLEGRLDERARIARELHDTLLQSFQGLLILFQAARNMLPERSQEAIRMLDNAIREGGEAITEGREAIQGLRINPALESSLENLLTITGSALAKASGAGDQNPAFRVTVEGRPQRLSPMIHDDVYGIAREILRNAFRHAHARGIEVEITYDPGFFRLRVRDDGKGIERAVLKEGAREGHWGLPGVNERANRVGAQFKLWSEPGVGTEAELSIPARIAYSTGKPQRTSAGSNV